MFHCAKDLSQFIRRLTVKWKVLVIVQTKENKFKRKVKTKEKVSTYVFHKGHCDTDVLLCVVTVCLWSSSGWFCDTLGVQH